LGKIQPLRPGTEPRTRRARQGTTSFGCFEPYGTWGTSVDRSTRARPFQGRGRRTDVAVRFSTVIGARDSAKATRDPRGAVTFSTEDGNRGLVGDNPAVFVVRDASTSPRREPRAHTRPGDPPPGAPPDRRQIGKHTSELQSREKLVCRLLLEK